VTSGANRVQPALATSASAVKRSDLGHQRKPNQNRSYGKEKPFCTESNEACWQQNRRGHLVYQVKLGDAQRLRFFCG
jgi:outer membrane protein OmpA-like peptidoglycan-associated protein